MAYPNKDDADFEEGYVTFVDDNGGEMIKVGHHMPNWGQSGGYRGCSMHPRPDFEIKKGMSIRVYAFQGLPERGVYIAGRVVRPYLTKEQGREQVRNLSKKRWDHHHSRESTFMEGVSTS